MNILVSACLLGEPVRYDGQSRAEPGIRDLKRRHQIFSFCPEVAGGLPVPRPPAELSGDAVTILSNGSGGVFTGTGGDVTEAFCRGAQRTLEFCREHGIEAAVLKERSPSCGVHQIYDGSHRGRIIAGQGLTAALLRQHGIRVYSEEDYAQLLAE